MIRPDDLTGSEIQALLAAHLENAAQHSPPGAVHALDLDGLRSPDVTFYTAWDGDDLLGCGALKELAADHGEIKSMHTASAHRRAGVGARVLTHLIDEARRRGYRRLSLETGATDGFAAARELYRRFGFALCPPFADYTDDGFSICMTMELAE